MQNQHGQFLYAIVALDFQEIRRNAAQDGIALEEIRVIFEGLDDAIVRMLELDGVNVLVLGNGKVMTPMLPSKYDELQDMAINVLKLGAD